MEYIETDVLIIGSGLAGLAVALHIDPAYRVLMTAKRGPEESNSNRAQGGIACAVDPDDSVEDHVRDTLETGAGLCDEKVVRTILRYGPAAVSGLEKLGIKFTRRTGRVEEYDLGREGGHSRRRVLHAGDITGHEVVKVLFERALEKPNVTFLPDHMAIDLVNTGWLRLPGPNRCVGAYFINRRTGGIIAVEARAVVLATGGAGKVYLYTSNEETATGDGVAMAWRAGLPIMNMEFVQFHPTCLYHPEAGSFLISEAVRGEGAELLNLQGEAFMKKYDPRGSLAPRDIVARAIDHEMKMRGDPYVYLDITHRSREFLQRRFPNIYSKCKHFGIDMASDPIPVVPAAHYFCGGVAAGTDGRTEMAGLYACGETACTGLHGANRLASNSLLEAVVCGKLTAEAVVGDLKTDNRREGVSIPAWQVGDAVPSDEAIVVEHNWNEVRTCMWDYVGIVRTNKRLERALRRIRNLRREIRQYYLAYLVTPDVLELRNIAAVAQLVVRSAQMRRESRGLHYTLDYPKPDDTGSVEPTVIRDRPGGPIPDHVEI